MTISTDDKRESALREETISERIRRSVTSAIPGMSVADMRQLLVETRTLLDVQNVTAPFDINRPLSNGQSVGSFAFDVTLGQHLKRARGPRKRMLASTLTNK